MSPVKMPRMDKEAMARLSSDCREYAALVRSRADLADQCAEAVESLLDMDRAGELEELAAKALGFLKEHEAMLKKVARK